MSAKKFLSVILAVALTLTASAAFAASNTFSITTTSLSDGTVGQSYREVLRASISGVRWVVASGALPDGLSLNNSTGVISGTPAAGSDGTYELIISATASGYAATAKSFRFVIERQLVQVEITKTYLNNGTVGEAYADAVTASPSGVTWSIVSGTIPAGLDFDAQTGVFTGTPTTAQDYTFTLGATNGETSARQQYTVTIYPANVEAVEILTNMLPDGLTGAAYTAEILTNKSSGVSFNATGLPAGLTMNGNIIEGTPTTAGEYEITVTATYTELGQTTSDTKVYTVNIADSKQFAITTTALPEGEKGTAYSWMLTATSEATWTVTQKSDGLAWMTVGSDGTISGTPTAEGVFGLGVEATDGTHTARATFIVTIVDANEPVVTTGLVVTTTSPLPDATVQTPYSATLTATYNGTPVEGTWRLANGTLPAGLHINQDGTITGTPTSSGTSTVQFAVTYNGQTAYSKYLMLTVNTTNLTFEITTTSPTEGKANTYYTFTFMTNAGGSV